MAKSLAFWLEGIKGAKPDIDLHVNYWLLHQNTDRELSYLDIGVKFQGLHDVRGKDKGSINIYFPFKVNKENYYPNLGELVCSRTDLIQTIFNSRHKSTVNSSNTSVDIEFESEKEGVLRVFTQISCSPENGGVRIVDTDEGSTLLFPLKLFNTTRKVATNFGSESESLPGYIRFRIKLNSNETKVISQSYKHTDSIILSRLESTEIVDFRLNEVRDLPGIIQSKDLIGAGIKNIHFFLIREVDSEYKQAHANFHRCRLLEKELWNEYLSLDLKENMAPKQMLIYHWKESGKKLEIASRKKKPAPKEAYASIEKFTAFAKFSKITVTYKNLLLFVMFALLIGAVSGAMGNVLYNFVRDAGGAFLNYVSYFYGLHVSK
ncbi:hypothetical protein [Pseudomonas kielensis]|uniref:Uncharacterized protein n=1 Tax=Pseudomonas kielensis TaxID=2762577 RepID=A0A7X1GD00_9PSED|nr:hypothetical protein [Pseudomonas kielensis]MBC2689795.1 hypothetical protein [Pseudomonas kielensis]